jgi:hypothetical protein
LDGVDRQRVFDDFLRDNRRLSMEIQEEMWNDCEFQSSFYLDVIQRT